MSDSVEVNIEWPNMIVSFGMFELEYDLGDVLEIEGKEDVELLEVTDFGLVLQYGEGETEFVDMRPLSTTKFNEEKNDD